MFSMERITFSLTDDRYNKLKEVYEKNDYSSISFVITESLDLYFKTIEQKYIIEFMYFICIPLLVFVVSIGLTYLLVNIFAYLVTAISGFYLLIFIYMFIDKYRGIKWL